MSFSNYLENSLYPAISECGDPVKAGEPSIIEYNKK